MLPLQEGQKLLERAVTLEPSSGNYLANLGETKILNLKLIACTIGSSVLASREEGN